MMKKINQKNTTPHIFTTFLTKNTKMCLNLILALTIFVLFLPICTLSCTKSLPKPQILSAYAQNSNNITTEEFSPDDLVAFVGTSINFKVYSQYEIDCTNNDGLTLTTSTISAEYYLVTISSANPIDSQIIIKNKFGGVAFANFSFIPYEIKTINLISSQVELNAIGDNYLQICYNDNPQLLHNESVNVSLEKGNSTLDTTDASEIIKSINQHVVVLNFENVDYTKYVGAKLIISLGSTSASIDLQIVNLPFTNTFTLQESTLEYFESTKSIKVGVLIDAESFATFSLQSSNFAEIKNIAKTKSSDTFDTYTLVVDISKSNNPTEIVICAQTASGKIERALRLVPINTISKIVISASKTSLKSGEKVVFSAILDDDSSLTSEIDWYINDQKVETSTQFECIREQGGTFTVYGKIGDTQSNSITLNVSYNNSELIVWYIVFAIALAILIALIIFKRKKKTFISSMSLIERARKFVPRYKTYINKYTRHQFFDLVYDIANLRDDVNFNFEETKDLHFEKAGRELADAHKIVRTIYKAPKEEKKTLLESNFSSFEQTMNLVIDDLNDYAQKHPNQAFFKRKNKTKQ